MAFNRNGTVDHKFIENLLFITILANINKKENIFNENGIDK